MRRSGPGRRRTPATPKPGAYVPTHGSGVREDVADRFESGLIQACPACRELVFWRRELDQVPICSTCFPPVKPSTIFAVAAARRLGVPAIVGKAVNVRKDHREGLDHGNNPFA